GPGFDLLLRRKRGVIGRKIRSPKSEVRKKPEIRRACTGTDIVRASDLFGFRPSDLMSYFASQLLTGPPPKIHSSSNTAWLTIVRSCEVKIRWICPLRD